MGRNASAIFSQAPRTARTDPLNTKKGFQYRRYDHQEDTAAEPCRCHLVGVRFTRVPFRKDFHGADQSQNRTDGIHQITARIEIAPYLTGGLVDAGRTVLGTYVKTTEPQRNKQPHPLFQPVIYPFFLFSF